MERRIREQIMEGGITERGINRVRYTVKGRETIELGMNNTGDLGTIEIGIIRGGIKVGIKGYGIIYGGRTLGELEEGSGNDRGGVLEDMIGERGLVEDN